VGCSEDCVLIHLPPARNLLHDIQRDFSYKI